MSNVVYLSEYRALREKRWEADARDWVDQGRSIARMARLENTVCGYSAAAEEIADIYDYLCGDNELWELVDEMRELAEQVRQTRRESGDIARLRRQQDMLAGAMDGYGKVP